MKYCMKYYGSAVGKSGKTYHFDKDEVLEADKGEFDESTAEELAEEKPAKKTVKRAGTKAETASVKKGEER